MIKHPEGFNDRRIQVRVVVPLVLLSKGHSLDSLGEKMIFICSVFDIMLPSFGHKFYF